VHPIVMYLERARFEHRLTPNLCQYGPRCVSFCSCVRCAISVQNKSSLHSKQGSGMDTQPARTHAHICAGGARTCVGVCERHMHDMAPGSEYISAQFTARVECGGAECVREIALVVSARANFWF